jgi:hypothetical protein
MRQRFDQAPADGGAHRLDRAPQHVGDLAGILRRERQRRFDRRPLDLGAGVLERLVGEIEAVAVQETERARRLDARLRRGVVEIDLSGFSASSGRVAATAPQTAALAARAAGAPFISVRARSSASGTEMSRA